MALQNLKTYFEATNTNDFDEMLKLPLVVSEKVQASSFHVKRTKEGKFEFYKSGQKIAMDKVDRTIVKYFRDQNNAADFIEELVSIDIKDEENDSKSI